MKKYINLIVALGLLFLAFLLLRHDQTQNDASHACEVLLKTGAIYPFSENHVPIEWVGGLPFVQVSVNGSPGLPFVLATGMGVCIFDEELARQLQISPVNASLSDAGEKILLGEIHSLRIGAADARNIPVLFNNLDWTLAHFGKFAAGFIGYGFWENFEARFDFPDSTLTLTQADSIPWPLENSDSQVVLPFDNFAEQPRHVFVKALVNEKEVSLEIDTMIRDGLYLAGTPDRYQPGVFFGDKNTAAPAAREQTIQTGRVSRLNLGGMELTDIRTQFSCIVSPKENFSDANVLGMGVLKHLKVTLNYKKQQLMLENK
jgi:hypothetical protein